MSGADRPERKALEILHACSAADVQFVSPETGWNSIAASRFRSGRLHINLPPVHVPLFGINYGDVLHIGCTGQAHTSRFKPGNLVVAAPDGPMQLVLDRFCDVVIVCLSKEVLDGAIIESTQRDPRTVEIVTRFGIRDLVLERIAHQLLREGTRPEHETQMLMDATANQLARHLLRAHSNLARPLERRGRTIPPRKLKRVKDFISVNLHRDLSLAEVAAVAEMTVFHFAKAFRQATGTAPHRYLTEHRILRARTLLHNPKLSIHNIATAVGFTHSHFTRLFTRYMGMTPTAFRNLL